MKTERRQELRTNELSALLLDANDWIKRNAYPVGGGVAVIVVAILAVRFVTTSRARSADDALLKLTSLSFADEEATTSMNLIDSVIQETGDRNVLMNALLRKGSASMNLAVYQDELQPEYLDDAENAYRQLTEKFPDRMPILALAYSSLTTIEETRFIVDQDLKHKEAAKNYLTRLQNDPKFKGTPFQTDAAKRLANLDEVFQKYTLAPPLPESEKTESAEGPNLDNLPISITTDSDGPVKLTPKLMTAEELRKRGAVRLPARTTGGNSDASSDGATESDSTGGGSSTDP